MAATPPVSRMTMIHNFIVEVEQDAVVFPQLLTALKTGTALPGPFSQLEHLRDEVMSAYNLFLAVKKLLSDLATLPK